MINVETTPFYKPNNKKISMHDLRIEAIYYFIDDKGKQREVHTAFTEHGSQQWYAPQAILNQTAGLTEVINQAVNPFIGTTNDE